jgi:hypothetical protein
LRNVFLQRTQVTETGLNRLRAARPMLDVSW